MNRPELVALLTIIRKTHRQVKIIVINVRVVVNTEWGKEQEPLERVLESGSVAQLDRAVCAMTDTWMRVKRYESRQSSVNSG